MRRTIEVFLGDGQYPVGKLHHNANGNRESSSFEYSAAWLQNPDRFQIDPALPLGQGPLFPGKSAAAHPTVFFGCIADSEPDGWGKNVIARDFAHRRKEAATRGEAVETQVLNSLDYLLAVDDVSRVGALRMQDENGVFVRHVDQGKRTTPPLIDLADLVRASHAIESNTETAADLRFLRGHGTSLGGMRPKASIVDDDGHLCIGKFSSIKDTRAVSKGEILALRLAARAGIDVASGRTVMAEDNAVAVIRRFDRSAGARSMYASARTLLNIRDDSDHAYTEIVEIIRSQGNTVTQDLHELWRRMVFNILVTNVDDHLSNHGFLHVRHGQWRLSPAFDINPFPDKNRVLKTWVSEEAGADASIESALGAARYFGLKPDEAKKILGEVENAVAEWREVALQPAVGMTANEIEPFADAFEHAERQVARRAIAG